MPPWRNSDPTRPAVRPHLPAVRPHPAVIMQIVTDPVVIVQGVTNFAVIAFAGH